MLGTLWGTDGYFRLPYVGAATDFGIGGSLDGDYDGVIFQWIDYQANPYESPWASGWDTRPDFDDQGAIFYAKFGAAGVNPKGRSVEFSGQEKTPLTVKQWASGIQLTAAIHHNEIGQGYEEFAWNMQHYEVAEKGCPWKRIIAYTTEYQSATVQIMKHFETGKDIPEFALIAGLKVPLFGGGTTVPFEPTPGKPLMIAFPKVIVFHARQGALSRQWALRSAKEVRRYPVDTPLRCVGYYHGESVNGDDRWLVIKSPGISNNARIHVSGVKEAIVDPGLPTA